MANSKSQRERERRAQREMSARHAAEKADRRRMIIAIAACGLILLAVAGTVIAASNNDDDTATSTTTTTSPIPSQETTTSTTPGPTVSVPPPATGGSLSGTTPCPAEDGSSPRITQFAGPPPACSDPAVVYDAVIKTSVGDIKVYLNSSIAPQAVNNFIVLARYHYYDGAPISSIISATALTVGADSTSGNPPSSPGYTLPGEHTEQGTIFPLGTLLMAKVPGAGDAFAGNFMLAIGEKAANLPPDYTNFGLTLDGTATLNAINKAGSESGAPTAVITITSVTIELAPVTTTTAAAP